MKVDLPEPLGPSTPKISPRLTCTETSLTAVTGLLTPFRFSQGQVA